MLIIGICGASGSGKSTLAENIRDRLNGKAMIIPMDCYYNDHPELCFEERALLDYDQPSSFAMDEFYEDLLKLKRGEPPNSTILTGIDAMIRTSSLNLRKC